MLVCVHILCIQQDKVVCLHLVFLTDGIVHKYMQNLHYAKWFLSISIMLEHICIYKTSFIAKPTVSKINEINTSHCHIEISNCTNN